MRNEPLWLPLTEVIKVNQAAVALTNEPHMLVDSALLESAWAKPKNHWHYGEDRLAILALQLLLGIARNHPFEQGNKRTAFTSAIMFLRINAHYFAVPDSENLGEIIRRVITGEISEDKFSDFFCKYVLAQ